MTSVIEPEANVSRDKQPELEKRLIKSKFVRKTRRSPTKWNAPHIQGPYIHFMMDGKWVRPLFSYGILEVWLMFLYDYPARYLPNVPRKRDCHKKLRRA
jgi:hypothetical protein